MGEILIRGELVEGVRVESRRQFFDERGAVMHVLNRHWPHFEQFGETYVSLIKQGVIKAWKRHRTMVQNFTVPVGEIKVIIVDDRPESPTRGASQEIVTGVERYGLVRIPSGVWYGFKGMAPGASLIINCASIPHDPAEVEGCGLEAVPAKFAW